MPLRFAWVVSAAIAAATLACQGTRAGGGATTAEAPPDNDDTMDCAERARVRPVCERAMAERCSSQRDSCEAGCQSEPGNLPGNGEKEPTLRADLEATRCRDRCRDGYEPCLRALLPNCPGLCE